MRPSDEPRGGQQEGRARGERGLHTVPLAGSGDQDRRPAERELLALGAGLGEHIGAAIVAI